MPKYVHVNGQTFIVVSEKLSFNPQLLFVFLVKMQKSFFFCFEKVVLSVVINKFKCRWYQTGLEPT